MTDDDVKRLWSDAAAASVTGKFVIAVRER